jgi:hypothetical protein
MNIDFALIQNSIDHFNLMKIDRTEWMSTLCAVGFICAAYVGAHWSIWRMDELGRVKPCRGGSTFDAPSSQPGHVHGSLSAAIQDMKLWFLFHVPSVTISRERSPRKCNTTGTLFIVSIEADLCIPITLDCQVSTTPLPSKDLEVLGWGGVATVGFNDSE